MFPNPAIDASTLFADVANTYTNLAKDGDTVTSMFQSGQDDLDEFITEVLDKLRTKLSSLEPAHSDSLDSLTSLFVTSESKYVNSQKEIKSVTPESVIKLPLPNITIETKTGEPCHGPWPTVLLQNLVQEVCAPVINEDASNTIRRDVVLWQQFLPSAGRGGQQHWR